MSQNEANSPQNPFEPPRGNPANEQAQERPPTWPVPSPFGKAEDDEEDEVRE